jgi:hypothetical protein
MAAAKTQIIADSMNETHEPFNYPLYAQKQGIPVPLGFFAFWNFYYSQPPYQFCLRQLPFFESYCHLLNEIYQRVEKEKATNNKAPINVENGTRQLADNLSV